MLKKNSDVYSINISEYKILLTIYLLNEKHYYPTHKGVNFILKGEINDDTYLFKDLETFKTLISLSNKKISFIVLSLIRHELIKLIYDKNGSDKYLFITDKGEEYLFDYKMNHKIILKKKNINANKKKEIIKI